MRARSPLVPSLLFVCLALGASAAPPRYRVLEGHRIRPAFGMNDSGTVAGGDVDLNANRMYPAIGTLQDLRRLPALMSNGEGRAIAVNDRLEVVGNAMTPALPPFTGGLVSHAYYWSEQTGPVDLTPNNVGASFAWAINDAGWIAGELMEGDNSGPFLWRVGAGGVVEERRIGRPERTSNTTYDINERGLVAGTHFNYGWVYDLNTDLIEPLPMSERGGAYGLNDRNEVVGFFRDPAFVRRTALWRRVGGTWTLIDLGALPDPNRSCGAIEINNAGLIIGDCIGPSGVSDVAFITDGGPLVPVQDLLVESDAARWSVVGVYDIDQQGRILAAARLDGAPAVAVILEPVERRRPARR
jgi:hypothetical protein